MKVKIRFLKDVELVGKTFLKNTIIEVEERDNDLWVYGESGHSKILSPLEVSIITGRELFTMDDMHSMADWSTDPYLNENRELRSKVKALEVSINNLTNINLILEEKLYESKRQNTK